MNITPLLQKLTNHQNLTIEETQSLFTEIFSGNISETELEIILKTLAEKGETVEEITAAAYIMQKFSLPVEVSKETFDVCGTGGSGNAKTFNLSTTVAFIMAAAGICTAKHGNRKASSQSGSADLLEALGIEVGITPKEMGENLEEKNMSFLFSQVLHPAMKYVMPVRKKIGTRTIFNFLGPLTNPSNPSKQLVGVSKKELVHPMAQILQKLGKKSAMVVCGEDGLDEITLTGKTYFAQFLEPNGGIESGEIIPENFGFQSVTHEKIAGGTPDINAKIILNIFNGTETGPKRDILLLNAGAGFFIAGKTKSIQEGIQLAKDMIESRKALELLKSFQK